MVSAGFVPRSERPPAASVNDGFKPVILFDVAAHALMVVLLIMRNILSVKPLLLMGVFCPASQATNRRGLMAAGSVIVSFRNDFSGMRLAECCAWCA